MRKVMKVLYCLNYSCRKYGFRNRRKKFSWTVLNSHHKYLIMVKIHEFFREKVVFC